MPISTALQNAQKHRRELYAFAKRNGLNVRSKMKTQVMESIVAPFKQAKASKIATAFKEAKLSTDKSYLDAINQTTGKVDVSLSHFNHIRKRITGRAKNDTTVYGDKRNTMFIVGSVGEHLFTIAPSNVTKGALDNPELVAKHGRADFRIKGGRVVFYDKKISFLDRYAVISYLYHHREIHLTPITQYNMPKLLNNKYQEVRSLTEGDFSASNFRLMGRVPGKELKLGQAVFRAFNSKTREYYDVRKYNVIYFDFETLVIDNVHVPYCVPYWISEFNENSPSSQIFSKTRNIYGFGCEKQFLEALPSNSKNLLWAYNAGFDARFQLKHMSYSSKDTNMIDCGSKIKQAHGLYKKTRDRY
ncbi:unnamed protein product [Phytophthora fragariaefolia]|uniref:Unnamed protein product n=1 Tax=Phytophthora fragariaefolia TaxID=1490495 RepID=A0A9W6XK49_9STRA|nr:unnamed protein product [Phytophthora fragariaefolia]